MVLLFVQLSSFFAGDAPQGAKLPANNTTGQESSDASQEEVNTEPEKTKPAQKEDPERKDSGETSRSESKSDEDLKSEELGAEKGMYHICSLSKFLQRF